MRLGFRAWEMVACVLLLLFAAAFFTEALLEATVYPMMDNYHQCGRIFLCRHAN